MELAQRSWPPAAFPRHPLFFCYFLSSSSRARARNIKFFIKWSRRRRKNNNKTRERGGGGGGGGGGGKKTTWRSMERRRSKIKKKKYYNTFFFSLFHFDFMSSMAFKLKVMKMMEMRAGIEVDEMAGDRWRRCGLLASNIDRFSNTVSWRRSGNETGDMATSWLQPVNNRLYQSDPIHHRFLISNNNAEVAG